MAKATKLPDGVFLAAAEALANCVATQDLAEGALYPKLTTIREVSAQIAADVAAFLVKSGLSGDDTLDPGSSGFAEIFESAMYDPTYRDLS